MHCSPKWQRDIASTLKRFLGDQLLTYEELCATGRATSLSPLDLKRKVLCKGKVKNGGLSWGPKLGAGSDQPTSRCRLLQSLAKPFRSSRGTSLVRTTSTRSTLDGDTSVGERSEPEERGYTKEYGEVSCEYGEVTLVGGEVSQAGELSVAADNSGAKTGNEAVDSNETGLLARARSKKQEKQRTEEQLASIIALRSWPFLDVLKGADAHWALPISSVNEDKLLEALGLSAEERNELEGLIGAVRQPTMRMGSKNATVAAPSVNSVVTKFAHSPPPGVATLQHRSEAHLVRPFPLGLRFSGANMNPLPAWLAGAQYVALNMTNVDLPVQLHHALFNGTAGCETAAEEHEPTHPRCTPLSHSALDFVR